MMEKHREKLTLWQRLRLILGRLFRKKIYYINGSDTLPPPLSAEEEEKMLSTIGEQASKDALVEHNLRLVAYIAKRFENTGANIEELISIGTVGLMKAVTTFNSEKNIKLATYASRCIENEILMYIRKNSNRHMEISIDEPLNTDWDGNELLLSDVLGTEDDTVYKNIEKSEDKKIISEALSKLGKREQIIINLRYGFIDGREKTQKEVADELGISQSYISRLEKKIIKRLKKEIEAKI
jgi:RNA polymerase sporulation-specific sigma factor